MVKKIAPTATKKVFFVAVGAIFFTAPFLSLGACRVLECMDKELGA